MTPYFRLYCAPLELRSDRVDVLDPAVKSLVMNPPGNRHAGWTLWSSRESQVTDEGLEAIGSGERRLILMRNGALEYWMPCLGDFFQWKQSESERKLHPWLYPYAICELPVSFFRLARAVYDHVDLDCEILAGMSLYSIQGFTLRPYKPGIWGFELPFEGAIKPYPQEDLKVRPQRFPADFVPDQVAFQLIKELYSRFEYTTEQVPCFDAEGHFSLE